MPIAIGIHGGCGTLDRSLMSEAEWAEARAHLADALKAGWAVLAAGRHAVDAVEAAVVVMEDRPHFNAGYGAALTEDGDHELDASIMNGETLGAGAVSAVRRMRNPIRAARAVMERSDCVLMTGEAADAFAARNGLAMVENGYFTTAAPDRGAREPRRRGAPPARSGWRAKPRSTARSARSRSTHNGNLAAATSTGGFNNKPRGRVGDSAGDRRRHLREERLLRGVVHRAGRVLHPPRGRLRHRGAHAVCAARRCKQATDVIVHETMKAHKIGAGLVAIDAAGNVLTPFNTIGMYRGGSRPAGELLGRDARRSRISSGACRDDANRF